MAIYWRLYRFDFEEYLELRSALSRATTPESLSNLADSEELDSVISALFNDEIEISEARQAVVLAKCCRGEPLLFSKKFLRLVTKLSRDPNLEECAEKIAEALAGGKNLEPWLEPSSELLSLMTPEEIKRIDVEMPLLLEACGVASRSKSGRSAGFFPTAGSFFMRLFDQEATANEMLSLFGEMVEYASSRGEGIVFVSANAG